MVRPCPGPSSTGLLSLAVPQRRMACGFQFRGAPVPAATRPHACAPGPPSPCPPYNPRRLGLSPYVRGRLGCGRGLLLDCGEGCLGQMERAYGHRQTRRHVAALAAIWISHRHAGTAAVGGVYWPPLSCTARAPAPPAQQRLLSPLATHCCAPADHMLGLLSLLAARPAALPPLLVVGPYSARDWLGEVAGPLRLRYTWAHCMQVNDPGGCTAYPGVYCTPRVHSLPMVVLPVHVPHV